jgi:small subunit ribosomal protein S3Ae
VRDKLMQMFKKGITLIECFTEVKTVDGYVLRIFAIAFTCKADGQINKNAKARATKRKILRAKMIAEIQNKCSGKKLQDIVNMIKSEKIEKDINESLNKIRPMNNITIRKVKMLRRPKFDQKEFMAL